MKKIEKILGILGLCSMMALGACDASVTDSDASTADGAGADTSTGTDTTGSDTVVASGYKYITIDGAPELNPDCTTSSAGADIDVIAVYDKTGKLRGVGKPTTVTFKAGAKDLCPTWGKTNQCKFGTIDAACHNDPEDVAGGLNTVMYADAKPDIGYFGLSGATVELQIGGCSVSTDDIKLCDGKGPAIEIMAGDEVDVYEVDGSYKGPKVAGKPASGIAPDACVCKAEAYEVWISKKAGEGLVTLGKYTGSKGMIKVQ